LQDIVDIERLLAANAGKLDMQRVRDCFRLFDRKTELDNILGLVASGG
jgi:hypothetical protein